MPDFTFTSPEGKNYMVSGPEGATKEQAFGILQQQIGTAKPGKIPQQSQMGGVEQFTAGLEKGMAGYPQAAANIAGSPEKAAKANLGMQMREQQIQQRGGLGVPGMVGEMVAQAPAMAAGAALGGPLGAVAGGAVAGGLAGLTQPVTTQGDYWNKKQDDILMGTAFGAGTSGALRLLGGFLGPKALPEAQKWLMDNGVQLTPGQISGDRGAGILRRVEEAAKSFPILGRFIAGAEGRGQDGFQRAIANQALEPIGGKLTTTEVGPALIKDMQGQADAFYDNVLPKMKIQFDHDLSQDLGQIRVDAGMLPEAMEKQFNAIASRRLMPMVQAQGPIPGGAMKDVDRAFRDLARDYKQKGLRQADPDAKMMGDLFERSRTAIRDAMGRQNAPELVQDLRKADQTYAMVARVEQAAQRRATSDSRFSPADMLQAIKSQDKSVRHRSFAAGDQLLQVYARYGQKVLPGKLPDSGTPERYMYDRIAHENLLTAGLDIGGAFTAAAPYTRPGMTVVNALARQSPQPFQAAGSVLRRGAPAAAPAGVIYGEDEKPPYGGPQQ